MVDYEYHFECISSRCFHIAVKHVSAWVGNRYIFVHSAVQDGDMPMDDRSGSRHTGILMQPEAETKIDAAILLYFSLLSPVVDFRVPPSIFLFV